MKRVDIKIGFLCNNQCKFCVQGDKRILCNNKTKEEIKKILREASKSYGEVVFTGGEPTIRRDIIELVNHAKLLGFKHIQIQTNGRMFFYKDFCKKMIEAGANEFSIAIHGPNKKNHDFLTSIVGSFQETTQGIRNLKELGVYVLMNTVITSYNYKFLPQIAQLLVDLDVDQFQFAFPHILGRAQDNKDWLIPRKSQAIDYVKRGLDIGIKAGKRVMTEAIPYCFMNNGYEKYASERVIPETKIFDANFVIDNYTEYRRKKGKAKRSNCKRCKYDSVCEGPWKEYPELFGWDEFISIPNI